MTDRERLIDLLCKVECKGADRRDGGCSYRQDDRCNRIEKLDMCMIECIADHLLTNGVIVPPCKVGDRLYEIVEMPKHTFISEFPIIVEPQQIIYRNIIGNHSCIPFDKIGKTVFLTRKDAEKALKEMNKA